MDQLRRLPVLAALAAVLSGGLTAGVITVVVTQPDLDPALATSRSATPVPATTPTTTGTTTATTRPPPTTTRRPSSTSPPATTARPPAPTSRRPPPPQPAEAVVASLVNKVRGQHGCGPVRVDARLVSAAEGHSADMARRDYFSHVSPEGVSFAERIRAAGYPSPAAENIAVGQRSAAQVMDGWMSSPGHRRNILDCDYTAIGVGLWSSGWYWTQDFGY